MKLSKEEQELCKEIVEVGMEKLAKRIDRLSKLVGVPWRDCGKHWDTMDDKTFKLRMGMHRLFMNFRKLLTQGRSDVFESYGLALLDYTPCGDGYTASFRIYYPDDEGRIASRHDWTFHGCMCKDDSGYVKSPDLNWCNCVMTATEKAAGVKETIRQVDDWIDVVERYNEAMKEIEKIEAKEERARLEEGAELLKELREL